MRLPPDAEGLVPRHAEDEALLAYLDGELDQAEAAATAAHLESCWRCRGRVNALETSIRGFLAARELLDPIDLSASPNADASFRRRLDDHARAVAPRVLPGAVLRGWVDAALGVRASRLRHALVGGLVVGVAFATASWWSAPVSAADILARADVHEVIDVRCADLVVRSVVDVERIDGRAGAPSMLGVVETLTDPASPAVRVNVRSGDGAIDQRVVWGRDALGESQAIAAAFPVPLARYLSTKQWAPGVDVRGYLRLIADRGETSASATRTGALVEVTHRFTTGHPSSLSESRLYVDATSWLPVRISLFGDTGDGPYELRFSRTTLEFLPRTQALAAMFAAARPNANAGVASKALSGRASASRDTATARRPLPLTWDAAPASDLEALVADALHGIDADLGEEVNVFPMSDGSLLVQGLVDTVARRQVIEQALQRMPGELRIEVRLPADLRGAVDMFAPPWRAPRGDDLPRPVVAAPVVVADAGGLRMPADQIVEAHLARERRAGGTAFDSSSLRPAVARYANDVVSRSREAVFHAWALFRLEQQFAPARTHTLSPAALASVARVRQSHRERLARLARALGTSIEPLVDTSSSARSVAPPGDAGTLLDTVTQADELVRMLFTVSAAPVDAPGALVRLSSLLRFVAQERVPLS